MRFFKILSVIICAVAVIFLAPDVYAVQGEIYFEDAADLYDDSEEAYIRSMLRDAAEHTGWNYGIVTLNEDISTLQSACTRAEQIYDENFGADSSGVLYMCDVGYRYFVIAGDARSYISGTRYDNMERKIKELYFDYRDLECAKVFISSTVSCYDKGEGSFDIYTPALVLGGVFAAVSAIIVFVTVNIRYKKYPKPEVNNYIDHGKTDIYRRDDTFVREFTTRHTHSSSSSGGGGGRGGGGHHGGGGFGGHR